MRDRPHFSFVPGAEVVLGSGEGSGRFERQSVAFTGRRSEFPVVSCFACDGSSASRWHPASAKMPDSGVSTPDLLGFSRLRAGRPALSGLAVLILFDGAFLAIALTALAVLYWRAAHL